MHQKIEKEAKFYIKELEKVESTILSLGAFRTQPATFEINMRFDTPDKKLTSSMQVLRLRQDTRARLTYKGPSDKTSTISARPEFEVEISDLETGRFILEALGYQISTIYEKYRTSYQIGDVEISLDRMPYGNFLEIEGANEASIQLIAKKIGLTWENRSSQSYMRLFETVKKNLGLDFHDLTFENFNAVSVKSEHLQLQFAD